MRILILSPTLFRTTSWTVMSFSFIWIRVSNPHPCNADHPQISFHAMISHSTQNSMLKRKTQNQDITILINRGSTHNFLQNRAAKFLGLPASPSIAFRVMLGNGRPTILQVCLQADSGSIVQVYIRHRFLYFISLWREFNGWKQWDPDSLITLHLQ